MLAACRSGRRRSSIQVTRIELQLKTVAIVERGEVNAHPSR